MANDDPQADDDNDDGGICAWTVKSYATLTSLSEPYIRNLIHDEILESAKIGGRRLILTPPKVFLRRHQQR